MSEAVPIEGFYLVVSPKEANVDRGLGFDRNYFDNRNIYRQLNVQSTFQLYIY